MRATWTNLDRIFDQIDDPETGLELLAKGPRGETPAQVLNDLFWQSQFTYWRDWLAGNVQAVALALMYCALGKKSPPAWLCRAVHELCTPDGEKRAWGELASHMQRWHAVELVRGRCPGDPRNYQKKVHPDDVWEEAATLVAGTDAEASAETVRKSHALIRRAGGVQVTLSSYRHELKVREGRRRKSKVDS